MNTPNEQDCGFNDVCAYGATPDDKTLCTAAIQSAIDACAEAGGGTVSFPPGTYLSGTLFMRSGVSLNLQAGSTLHGSPNQSDYPITPSMIESRTSRYNVRSLIVAENLEKIAIVGQGVIDGNGKSFLNKSHDGSRPLILRVAGCRDVLLEGITMQSSGFWNQHFLACERVRINGIRVYNHATYNNDGLDIDGCRDVVVSGCILDSDDDALCLKSTSARPCENVVISDCVVSSHCNGIKMGTDSTGGFIDIVITNCTIRSPRHSQVLYGFQRGISGISLELVDGGRMERVAISNISVVGVEVPLFIRLGNRGTGLLTGEAEVQAKPPGILRDVVVSNFFATDGGKTGCPISGIPGSPIQNLTLRDVAIRSEGNGPIKALSADVPEQEGGYPEATMFGTLPAHGLFCRHIEGLSLHNVRLEADAPDPRHSLVMEDVANSEVVGLSCGNPAPSPSPVRLTECRNALFSGCRPGPTQAPFLEIVGEGSAGVALVGNDFGQLAHVAAFAAGADASCVRSAGNV